MKRIYIALTFLYVVSAISLGQTNYTTVPGSRWDDHEKTWILKCIETDENGKITVKTRYITNSYSETVKVGDVDCVDLMEPLSDEDGNIVFNHYVFKEYATGMVYRCYGYDDYKILNKSFDFTLVPGQQLERFDHSKYGVTDCGFAYDYNSYWPAHCPDRRMLKVHRMDADQDDVWIEGVGSIHTGLLEPSDFITSEVYVQSMVHGSEDCAFFCIDTDVYKSVPFEAEIIESSNPIVDEIIMDQSNHNTTFDMEFIDDTLHVKGALFGETQGPLKTLEAEIDDDTIILNINEHTLNRFSSGVPFRFDVKIPGFKAGTYKIRYQYKNPIDVVCYGNATAIEAHKTISGQQESECNAIYDLSGRRLNQAPERGLYIQNGKKVINY